MAIRPQEMRLDQVLALRTFVRIAEARSLAKAAGSLDLPRSTVSKLLQDLENHLGTQLVSRSTRATTVTPEGEAYYLRALRLLGDLDEMDAEAGGNSLRPSGRLRVDIGSNLANLILIPKIPAFLELHPDVELVLGVSDRAIDLVGDGVDCVIRGGTLADSSLIARRLGELRYVTCAAPGYFDRYGIPRTIEDIEEKHRALAYFSASTGASFPLRFREDGEQREVRPRLMMSVNESTAHMTALLAGLGIGQTFEFAARSFLQDDRLVEILPEMRPDPHPLHLVYPAHRNQSAKLRAFADWAVTVFQQVERGPA
jgi:DNA-binding transcriptional LysR family regulator